MLINVNTEIKTNFNKYKTYKLQKNHIILCAKIKKKFLSVNTQFLVAMTNGMLTRFDHWSIRVLKIEMLHKSFNLYN